MRDIPEDGVVIGELFPAFVGTDWIKVPAFHWRHYSVLAVEIYGQSSSIKTRTLEEYAWRHACVLAHGVYLKNDKNVIVDFKPIVHEWNETDRFIAPSHLEAEMMSSEHPRPVRLTIRGLSPRPLKTELEDLDVMMWKSPSSPLSKEAYVQIGRTLAGHDMAIKWGFDSVDHLRRYVINQEDRYRDSGMLDEPFLPYTRENHHQWMRVMEKEEWAETERAHCWAKGRGPQWDQAWIDRANVERGFCKGSKEFGVYRTYDPGTRPRLDQDLIDKIINTPPEPKDVQP